MTATRPTTTTATVLNQLVPAATPSTSAVLLGSSSGIEPKSDLDSKTPPPVMQGAGIVPGSASTSLPTSSQINLDFKTGQASQNSAGALVAAVSTSLRVSKVDPNSALDFKEGQVSQPPAAAADSVDPTSLRVSSGVDPRTPLAPPAVPDSANPTDLRVSSGVDPRTPLVPLAGPAIALVPPAGPAVDPEDGDWILEYQPDSPIPLRRFVPRPRR